MSAVLWRAQSLAEPIWCSFPQEIALLLQWLAGGGERFKDDELRQFRC